VKDEKSVLQMFARDVLEELLHLENGQEIQRVALSSRKDFTLSGAFNFFAKTTQYKLNHDEF